MPKYKEKRIQEIKIENKILGHICGVNLKPLNYSDEKELEEYINKIRQVMEDEYKKIYIEEEIPIDIRKKIKKGLSMGETNFMDIRIYNIPYILEGLITSFKGEMTKEELLIISNNKDECLRIIDGVFNSFSFISVLGLNEGDGESLYEEVLEATGISVYLPHYNNISLRRYGLIINTLDNLSIDLTDIKKKAIIMDYSQVKPFAGINRYVIEDISLNIGDLGLDENPWIGNEIDSDLFTSLFKKERQKFCRIYKNDSLLTINDFINQEFKIKGDY